MFFQAVPLVVLSCMRKLLPGGVIVAVQTTDRRLSFASATAAHACAINATKGLRELSMRRREFITFLDGAASSACSLAARASNTLREGPGESGVDRRA